MMAQYKGVTFQAEWKLVRTAQIAPPVPCSPHAAVTPQIRVEPELRAELESVLLQGETPTDFVEAAVRSAIAFRRIQISFHARAQAASVAYHHTGVSVPVKTVLDRLQTKLDAERKKLGP